MIIKSRRKPAAVRKPQRFIQAQTQHIQYSGFGAARDSVFHGVNILFLGFYGNEIPSFPFPYQAPCQPPLKT